MLGGESTYYMFIKNSLIHPKHGGEGRKVESLDSRKRILVGHFWEDLLIEQVEAR